MSNPTPAAMKAARKLTEFYDTNTVEEDAAIIDRETGLPELLRQRDALLTDLRNIVNAARGEGELLNDARAAIALCEKETVQ